MTGNMTTISERNAEVPGLITDGVIPLSRREVFWQARYLQDSPALVHLPFLFWLAADLRPRRSATLNMGDGVMHFALCQAVDKSGLESLCQGFGRWQGEVPETLDRHNASHYAEFSKLGAADASQALRRIRRREIDLILVEAPLDAATVEALAESWLPRLSANGVVVIDGAGEGDDATAEALERLQAAHPHIFFDEGAGLLVLLPGEAPPERLLRLAGIERDSVEEMVVHRVFARLGQLHLKEWAVRDLQGRIERIEGPAQGGLPASMPAAPVPATTPEGSMPLAEVEALRQEHVEALQLLTRTLEETEERAIAQSEALKAAQYESSTARNDTDRLTATVAAQAAEVEALQRQLSERDDLITNLEGSRTAGKRRLRETERELTRLKARYDALAADREALLSSREALLGSTSWKLTAPLRQIRGGGRKP